MAISLGVYLIFRHTHVGTRTRNYTAKYDKFHKFALFLAAQLFCDLPGRSQAQSQLAAWSVPSFSFLLICSMSLTRPSKTSSTCWPRLSVLRMSLLNGRLPWRGFIKGHAFRTYWKHREFQLSSRICSIHFDYTKWVCLQHPILCVIACQRLHNI